MLVKKCKQRLCSVSSLLKNRCPFLNVLERGKVSNLMKGHPHALSSCALSIMFSYLALVFLNEKSSLHYFISARTFIFVISDGLTPIETVIRNLLHTHPTQGSFSGWDYLCFPVSYAVHRRKIFSSEKSKLMKIIVSGRR